MARTNIDRLFKDGGLALVYSYKSVCYMLSKSAKALKTFEHHRDNQTSTAVFDQKAFPSSSISTRRVLAHTPEAAGTNM